MSFETFKIVVMSRIDKHKADEAAKIERIREEERVKAEAAAAEVFEAARAKAEAEAKAESDRIAAEVTRSSNEKIAAAANEAATIDQLASDEMHEAAAIEARRKQAQLNESAQIMNKVSEAGMVTISKKEYERLLADSKWLKCLNSAGVDNWEGWDSAMEAYNQLSATTVS